MRHKTVDIKTLKQNDQNFNVGSSEGMRLIEKSFSKFGAGRSILIDKDNNIISGNKSAEIAQKVGINKVKVVESDGTKLVVVRRADVTPDARDGRELALAENVTALINQTWNLDLLANAKDMCGGIDIEKWGLHLDKMSDGINSLGEIDMGDWEEEMILKLTFYPEIYNQVLAKLKEVNEDIAEALLQILGYYEEESDII